MNVWSQFKKLLPSQALQAGEVIALHTDGTCTVRLPDGRELKVLGTTVPVGSMAFVRGGELVGPAPSLPVYYVEV